MNIAIIGAGKLGTNVAEALEGGNYTVTVIDKDANNLQRLSQSIDVMTVLANGKQLSNLKDINIAAYDFLLAATGDDEKNIFIASAAKKLGAGRVIARIRDPEHMNQFDFIKENFSIDHIVNPDLLITVEIYKYLVEKYTLSNGIFSSGKVSLLEFYANRMKKLVGASLTDFPKMLPGMLVVGVSRNGKVIIPHGDTTIEESDGLYVIGEKNAVWGLASTVRDRSKYKSHVQKVMIIGGGKTGLYLADKLSDFGAYVKLIERDKARCQYLSTHLKNVMVLYGDGTDVELLKEENIDDMDAFVTATGYDEDNLLLALTAKQRGIDDVIAKISRESYANLIGKLGIDMALNPLDITTSNILRFIQGGRTVLSSQLIQGQAEIMEIVASSNMKFVNRPLKSLILPEGMLIGAIHRGSELIIPNGETVIRDRDRVIIICLLSDLPEIEKLLKAGEAEDRLK